MNPNTWEDSYRLNNIKACSITRDSTTDTLGSATFEAVGLLGESYINRSCYYKENEIGLSYKEIYNIKENTTKIITNVPNLETEVFDEIREVLEEIKDNFKKNNNKKIKHL